MKTKIKIALSFLVMNICNSCENKEINSSYIIHTKNSPDNNNQNLIILKHTLIEVEQPKIKNTNAKFTDEISQEVSLKEEIAKLFDPVNHACSLPDKISNRLKGKKWAPKMVTEYISQIPDNVLSVSRTSITSVLHMVKVKKENGSTFNWPIKTSSSEQFNIDDYVLTTDYNSFFYSLDCSGYVNAAIEASASIPGADIKSVAETSLKTDNSMFVAGGVIVSPLSASYYGNLVDIDKVTRIKVLEAIVSIPNISDSDIIEMPLSFEAIWASKAGNSSFNGKGELKGKGGTGFATAQISANSSAGGSISRSSRFASFNTFISKAIPIKHPTVIKISDVKIVLQKLKNTQ